MRPSNERITEIRETYNKGTAAEDRDPADVVIGELLKEIDWLENYIDHWYEWV